MMTTPPRGGETCTGALASRSRESSTSVARAPAQSDLRRRRCEHGATSSLKGHNRERTST